MRNEGHAVGVAITPNADGTSTFAVSLTGLPAPEKTFTCDGLNIRRTPDGCRLIFSQSKAWGDGARALVDIEIAEAAIEGFVLSLEGLARKEGPSQDFVVFDQEPESSLALSANFIRLASNSFGHILDFYYASPFAMEYAGKSQSFHFKDVLRIQTTERVFFSLVQYFLSAEGWHA